MKIWISISILIMIAACSAEPEPITYGEDECHLCRMTIVDQRYGTEAVTSKGKVYKFDSVECLLDFLKKNKDTWSHVLVTPYDKPEQLIPASGTAILKSKNLPSPMGMGLTAFTSQVVAKGFREKYGGTVYSWQGMQENHGVEIK